MRRAVPWIWAVLLVAQAPGAAQAAGEAGARGLPDVVVDAHWLRRHLDVVTVVDARPAAAYAAGHIPGAASLPSEAVVSETAPARLQPLQRLRALIEAAGVRPGRPVVVYDEGALRAAARLFWLLELLGHPAVAVLDGGWPAWAAQDGAAASGAPAPAGGGRFVPAPRSGRLATRLDVLLAPLRPEVVLLDARPPDDPGPPLPGAVRLPARRNLDGQGRLLPRPRLRALYGRWLERGRRFVVYCEGGRDAALAYLALRRLGAEVALYHGSLREWRRAQGGILGRPLEVPRG